VDTVEVDSGGPAFGDSADRSWLEQAVDLATANVERSGGPFGALVVRDGHVVGRGTNRVTAELDPTAHAEVVAIRAACREVDDFSLAGAALYASCEPCPLCLAASLWARLDRVVFAADRHAAERAGFDDSRFHALLGPRTDLASWPMEVRHIEVATARAPFDAWQRFAGRIPY
jgi:guanine deaminase